MNTINTIYKVIGGILPGCISHLAPRADRAPLHRGDAVTVRSYLDLSTAYLPEHERTALSQRFVGIVPSTPIVDPYPHGWWVHVPDAHGLGELSSDFVRVCPALARIIREATRLDCMWIRLDADGGAHRTLPYYDG